MSKVISKTDKKSLKIKELEVKLRAVNECFNVVQSVVLVGCWEWDIVNDTIDWSDEIYRIFGMVPQESEATFDAFLEMVHSGDRDLVGKSIEKALSGEARYNITHRVVLRDGTEKIVNDRGDITFSDSGEPLRMIGTVQDVTEIKVNQHELKKLATAIEHSINMIIITGTDGKIEYVNKAFEDITSYSKDDIIGETPRVFADVDVDEKIYKELFDTIWAGRLWRGTFKNVDAHGNNYWVNASISPISDDKGEITSFISVQENITDKMESAEKIRYLAHHDSVTGVLNRNRFIELLDQWLGNSMKSVSQGILIILNVDDFKSINDTYGHLRGDDILKRIGMVIGRSVRETYSKFPDNGDEDYCLVARFGSDEFGVFIPIASENNIMEVVEKLHHEFEINEFGKIPVRLTVSLGVSLYPKHGICSSDLLSKADIGCFRAKREGGNSFHIFKAEDRDFEKLSRRMDWREKIQKGLDNDDFIAYFQPLQNFETGRLDHFEALARLKGTFNHIYAPGNFIDIAESFGLIGKINRMMMVRAMEFLVKCEKYDITGATVGVNLSGKDLNDGTLLKFIGKTLDKYKVNPSNLIFEITETAAVSDIGLAKNFIGELKAMGISFALDDFGVGFTSFKYLQEMEIDYIKIDGSFIKRLDENKEDLLFVKAIVDVARGMGIKTIAEYVETESVYDILKELKVDYAQGYYISKPAPLEDLKGLVKASMVA